MKPQNQNLRMTSASERAGQARPACLFLLSRSRLVTLLVALLVQLAISSAGTAQSVDVQIQSRETYVGMPLILRVSIRNATDYEVPTIPPIDGCDIRQGTPTQSSQITIINGNRSESRSVQIPFALTARKPGTFEIPSFDIVVDGKTTKTRSLKFVASKSETGDLLFVEIEGGKERVYVGEPLELTLKVWVKPYRDRKNRVVLSEGDMWQQVSNQTSWGSFRQVLQDLADRGQRPGGQEVLREDKDGKKRSYYLYEVLATVYPNRPGKINADDVQIVVNFPTALGRSRDPFEAMFRSRLSVVSTRPVVAEASVDSTEVLSVPTEGRPDDYRGAVGVYDILTRATPNAVNAGDPITLNIGVRGDGPMELIQAPPLSTLLSLTNDFKVTDQSLAGFVQDDTKVFSTTIRPRQPGVTEIPEIPFSFFDPSSDSFKTVYSEPISIAVNAAETLALDSIVGTAKTNRRNNRVSKNKDAKGLFGNARPDFNNSLGDDFLKTEARRRSNSWWWIFVVVPPLVWLGTLLMVRRESIFGWASKFKPASERARAKIEASETQEDVIHALVTYVAEQFRHPCNTVSEAVGVLRINDLIATGNEVESFVSSRERSSFDVAGGTPDAESLREIQRTAKGFVGRIEDGYLNSKKRNVRKSVRPGVRATSWLILVVGTLAFAGSVVGTGHCAASNIAAANNTTGKDLESGQVLTPDQRNVVLQEANESYVTAQQLAESDAAESNDRFSMAAEKYQMLVDSGFENSELYMNLGNAYLQSRKLGRAIASYKNAHRLNPAEAQIIANLEFALSKIKNPVEDDSVAGVADKTIRGSVLAFNESILNFVGRRAVIFVLVIASFLFWGAMILKLLCSKNENSVMVKYLNTNVVSLVAKVCLPFLLVPLAMILMSQTTAVDTESEAIVIVKELRLHSGDGEQFEVLHSLNGTEGQSVSLLAERGAWVQIKTLDGKSGWTKQSGVEALLN